MKNGFWVIIGAVVGFASGMIYGFDYAVAGAGIGVIGGGAIYAVLRGR